VGTYALKIGKFGFYDNINLVISCASTSVVTPSGPLALDYIIGKTAVTGTMVFSLSPYCGYAPTITFTGTPATGLLSVTGMNYSLYTTSTAEKGLHTYTITATNPNNAAVTNSSY
jgi:hypothetical protein